MGMSYLSNDCLGVYHYNAYSNGYKYNRSALRLKLEIK